MCLDLGVFALSLVSDVGVHYKASPRARCLGELLLGQGLCEGLDESLLEVVVLGLVTCGLVSWPRLLVGGVHRRYYISSWKWKGSRNCLRLMEN